MEECSISKMLIWQQLSQLMSQLSDDVFRHYQLRDIKAAFSGHFFCPQVSVYTHSNTWDSSLMLFVIL